MDYYNTIDHVDDSNYETRTNRRNRNKASTANTPFVGEVQPHKSRKTRRQIYANPGPGHYDNPSPTAMAKSIPRQERNCSNSMTRKDQTDFRDYLSEPWETSRPLDHPDFTQQKRELFHFPDGMPPGPGNYDIQLDSKAAYSIPQSPRHLNEKVRKSRKPGPGEYEADIFQVKERSKKLGRFSVSPRFGNIPFSPS